MKKLISVILCLCFLLTGCIKNSVTDTDTAQSNTRENTSDTTAPDDNLVIEDKVPEFLTISDPGFLQYITDVSYASTVDNLASEDYEVLSVNAIYLSKEYIEELDYNSKSNVFFGYTLAEVEEIFQGKKFVFTLGDDGKTTVKELEVITEEDSIDKIIRNVAIGTGVILVCVVMTSVTAGASTPFAIFWAGAAAGAKSFALNGLAIGAISAGALKLYQTGELDTAIDEAVVAGSEGFKWGAISGAITGGIANTIAAKSVKVNTAINTPRQSELAVLDKYPGREQVSYLNRVEVPASTPGATRPDIIRTVGNHIEAIEVKNYDLVSNSSLLKSELKRQISQRIVNLPEGSTQRIVLDVTGRNYSRSFVNAKIAEIQASLSDIYPNIPIDFIGL